MWLFSNEQYAEMALKEDGIPRELNDICHLVSGEYHSYMW